MSVIVILCFKTTFTSGTELCKKYILKSQTLSNVILNITFAECPLGFHSSNCSETCIFPSFGRDCQSICNCSVIVCDHRFGCKDFIGMFDFQIGYF